MSTSRGGGRAVRKKVETPGRTGVEFEAVQGSGGNSQETFSYDEVSSLSTVTPAAKRPRKGRGSKAVARAKATAGGKEVGNGKHPDRSTTEEAEGGAAKRRKQRRQEQQQQQQDRSTATASGNAGLGSANGDAAKSSGGVGDNERERAVAGAGKGKGLKAGQAPVAAGKSGGKRRRSRSSAMGLASAGKRVEKGHEHGTRPTRKLPAYPKVGVAFSGKADTLWGVLEEAVAAEVQGLMRPRGLDAACKVAVHACMDVGQEILRQAEDIATDLDATPRLDLKEVRRVFDEERRRQRDRNDEEERLWAAEEARCLTLMETNKQAQAKVQQRAARLRDSPKALEEEEEEEEGAHVYAEGLGTAKRISEQLLASTDDMILNAGAIGRCLQEMGAGVADAQETKDKLVRAFRQRTLRNYPNVDNPKAMIAAILK